MPSDAPSEAQVRAALDELLGWQGISRSPQLSELLRYVVEKTLAGDVGSIKAYAIAVDVFGRPQTFDPQSDPIVRVQARRLRTLLEQFYDTGKSAADVEIRMPLGRYVPEFAPARPRLQPAELTPTPAAEQPIQSPASATPPGRMTLNRFYVTAVLGACFTIIGVGLVVFLLRWTFPPSTSVATSNGVPDFPTITIGAFDNLTGQTVLDDDVAAVAQRVSDGLAKFELIRVVPNGGRFLLKASVQESEGQYSVKAMLSQNGEDGIVWSTTINPPKGTDTDALTAASTGLAAMLGAPTGPLHAADRAWVAQQSLFPGPPSLYVCALQYIAWRDVRKLASANVAADCLKRALAASPNDALALAEDAGLRAWIAGYDSPAGVDQVQLLSDEATEAGRATSLMPNSSNAYQQQGLVFARQGLLDVAMAALKKAVDLNPASMDALVTYGLLQWLNGDFTEGVANAERAIALVPSPPPYYYMTRAFDALRQRRLLRCHRCGAGAGGGR